MLKVWAKREKHYGRRATQGCQRLKKHLKIVHINSKFVRADYKKIKNSKFAMLSLLDEKRLLKYFPTSNILQEFLPWKHFKFPI